MNKFQIQQIEKYVKKRTGNLSPVHGFEHLKKTAVGAAWFAKVFGESEADQLISYLAGLIHDLERPNSEKIDHADISVREAKKVLADFSVSVEDTEKILQQISEHREFASKNLSTQWVFLSDKILEQSGAYVIFRRFYYIGECDDYQGVDFFEAAMDHWTYRMNKFSPNKYPSQVRNLAKKQFIWQEEFINGFAKKEVWAVDLGKTFFNYGRVGKKNLEKLIREYSANNSAAQKFQQEALSYIAGEKYQKFKSFF